MKIIFALSLLASVANAFVVQAPVTRTTKSSLNMYRTVEDAIAEAEDVCRADPHCEACRAAWDVVDDLDHDIAHTEDVDDLLRDYDVLTDRLQIKLDQLVATTDRLQDMGARHPAMDELGHRAEEMKRQLAYVQEYLDQQ